MQVSSNMSLWMPFEGSYANMCGTTGGGFLSSTAVTSGVSFSTAYKCLGGMGLAFATPGTDTLTLNLNGLNPPFTIAYWFYASGLNTIMVLLTAKDVSSGTTKATISAGTGGNLIISGQNGPGSPITSYAWNYVTYEFQATTIVGYVTTSSYCTKTITSYTGTYNQLIFGGVTGLDDIRIYTRLLSSAEMLTIYNTFY